MKEISLNDYKNSKIQKSFGQREQTFDKDDLEAILESNLRKGFIDLDTFEKAQRDLSKLVQKPIIDKNGKRRMMWVKKDGVDLHSDLHEAIKKHDKTTDGGAEAYKDFKEHIDNIKSKHNLDDKQLHQHLSNHFANNNFSDGDDDYSAKTGYDKNEAKEEARKLIDNYKKQKQSSPLKSDLHEAINKFDRTFDAGDNKKAHKEFKSHIDSIKEKHGLNDEQLENHLARHFSTNSFSDGDDDWNSAQSFGLDESKQNAKDLMQAYTGKPKKEETTNIPTKPSNEEMENFLSKKDNPIQFRKEAKKLMKNNKMKIDFHLYSKIAKHFEEKGDDSSTANSKAVEHMKIINPEKWSNY